jgi:hypothetical protein
VIDTGRSRVAALFSALCLWAWPAVAEEPQPNPGSAGLAQQLLNPVAALISVPFENNLDFDAGPARATSYTGNLKPVIPFSLGKDWNLITRTVVPFISTGAPELGGARASGVGDITITAYLSPNAAAASGWYWGVGPALIVPSAGDASIGSGKWSAGPTAAVLRQIGPWTWQFIAGHVWSFAGDRNLPAVSTTVLQPTLSFTTTKNASFGIDTTASYDWTSRQWTLPVELSASQLFSIGKQSMSIGMTGRYAVRHPTDDPEWGLVLTLTLLFPK